MMRIIRLKASGHRFQVLDTFRSRCPVTFGSGEGGIRTPDAGITDVTVFETAAFNHSATSPWQSVSTAPCHFNRL
jgi:hypothetical protein